MTAVPSQLLLPRLLLFFVCAAATASNVTSHTPVTPQRQYVHNATTAGEFQPKRNNGVACQSRAAGRNAYHQRVPSSIITRPGYLYKLP